MSLSLEQEQDTLRFGCKIFKCTSMLFWQLESVIHTVTAMLGALCPLLICMLRFVIAGRCIIITLNPSSMACECTGAIVVVLVLAHREPET